MTEEGIVTAFAPPLSLRLNGGLRGKAFALPLAPVEALLGVQLALKHDLELGGVHYIYTPDPVPVAGLVGVLACANDASHSASTYAARPDLRTALTIEWFGFNLLDLGRLEWQLRGAYGDLFDVAEYSIVTRPDSDTSLPSEVHWVQFASVDGYRGRPFADTPILACLLDFELPASIEARVRATLISLNDDTAAVLRAVEATPLGDAAVRLTVNFDTPSLLELGRYAQAVEQEHGRAVLVSSYTVSGGLQRGGHTMRIERSFVSRENALPSWLPLRDKHC